MNEEKKFSKFQLCIFKIIPILLIPALIVLIVISMHSKLLVTNTISNIIYVILALLIYLLIVGLFIIKRKKKRNKKKKEKIFNAIKYSFLTLYIIGCISFLILLYGPNESFKNWLISTAMKTMNHQYLCKWFYSDKEINKILGGNYIVEVEEETDISLINNEEEETYANEYEKQILKRDKNAKYKIIELEVNGQKGYLAAIYDPSLVKVAVTSGLGRYGQYVTKMAEDHNAILAINGGGFYDPGYNSTGGQPGGITIANGKIVTNNEYGSYSQGGGIIGITNDNVLVLMKSTAQKAIEQGVRDAVTWGPFLIVNGKKSFIKGNGGWGYAARTAIGQRADGIILLLTIDSNSTRTKGADMVDLTEIMSNYGAINAANLDGGTSTVMVLPKNEALQYNSSCNTNYCYINDPIDGALRHRTRGIATSFIVTN